MIIREDFKIIFEVNTIGSIKAWKEGKVDGVPFPPSVKFRCTNIESKQDIDVGEREIETIVDFQVNCPSLESAVLLQESIRKKRTNNESILLSGVLPNKEGSDNILKIKSVETFEDFLKRNKIVLGVQSDKK